MDTNMMKPLLQMDISEGIHINSIQVNQACNANDETLPGELPVTRLESQSVANSPVHCSPVYSSSESWSMARDFLSSGSPPSSTSQTRHKHSRYQQGQLMRAKNYLEEDDWDIGDPRPRVSSMPTQPYRQRYGNKLTTDFGELCRVRSFTITPKGVVDGGDYYINRSMGSIGSTGALIVDRDSPILSCDNLKSASKSKKVYKVMVVGTAGVGKSSLIKQFLKIKSDYYSFSSFDDELEKSVSVLLDGAQSTMKFFHLSDDMNGSEIMQTDVDAYVVVYSVEDRHSLEMALNILHEIREEEGRYIASILVANKTDLVRSRSVPEEEGRTAAKTYGCKYIEVSAAIGHKIDELLVGVLKQIRLFKQKYDKDMSNWKGGKDTRLDGCCFSKTRDNVITKLFKGDKPTSRSCGNLYIL